MSALSINESRWLTVTFLDNYDVEAILAELRL